MGAIGICRGLSAEQLRTGSYPLDEKQSVNNSYYFTKLKKEEVSSIIGAKHYHLQPVDSVLSARQQSVLYWTAPAYRGEKKGVKLAGRS